MSLLLPLLCLFLALQWLITFSFFFLINSVLCTSLVLISWINIHDSSFQATRSSVDVCFTILLSNILLQNRRSFSFQRLRLESRQLSSTQRVIWSWCYYLDRYSFLALLNFAIYIFKETLHHPYLQSSTKQAHWSKTQVCGGFLICFSALQFIIFAEFFCLEWRMPQMECLILSTVSSGHFFF